MGNGYTVPATDSIDQLMQLLRDLDRRVSECEMFTGAEVQETVKRLQELIDGILEQTEINVSGNITAGGDLTVTGQMTSPGVAGFDVTTLPGGRSSMWIHDASGRMGQTTSSIVYKTNLEPVPFTAGQFLEVMPYLFEYITQCDIRDNPENPNYDPAYVVPVDVGMMAEHLVAAGLNPYVQFAADGVTPRNIDYATFASHAALVIGRDHETRLQAIEERLATV